MQGEWRAEKPLSLPESEGMQQAGMGQGEDAEEQKRRAAVEPGVWRLQEAATVRPVAAAAAAKTAF